MLIVAGEIESDPAKREKAPLAHRGLREWLLRAAGRGGPASPIA